MNLGRFSAFVVVPTLLGIGIAWVQAQDTGVRDVLGERPVRDFVVHDERFMLQGEQAFLQANGFVRVEGVTVQTSDEGKINLEIKSPVALYDEGRTNVRSSLPITVRSADNRFLMSGDGFSLFPATEQLTITSNVVTRFDRRFFSKGSTPAADLSTNTVPLLSVLSQEFYYDHVSGDAEYRRGVHFTDGEALDLKAGLVRFNTAALTNETAEVRAINDVEIALTLSNGLATARSFEAILRRSPGMDAHATLIGNPMWTYGALSGESGLLELTVVSNRYDVLATNNASMRIPAENFGDTGQQAETTGGSNWVDIASDHYRLSPEMLSFHEDVVVRQGTNWSAGADQLSARLNPTNGEPTEMEALGNFVFNVNQPSGRGEGRADRAVFDRVAEEQWRVSLTGDPHWVSPEFSTTADEIQIEDPMGAREIIARGSSRLVLSGELLAGLNWFETSTHQPAQENDAGEFQPVTITSDEYELNGERVVFTGDVVVSQSTNSLTAPTLTIWFTPDRRAERLHAERGVVARNGPHTVFAQTLTAWFDGPGNTVSEVQANEDVEFNSEEVYATGANLVYQASTSEVVLGGDPTVIATRREPGSEESLEHIRRVRFDGPKITVNLVSNTVHSVAPYTFQTLPLDEQEEIGRP